MASSKNQDFQSHTVSGNVATILESFRYRNKNGEDKEAQKFRLASNQGTETIWYQVNIFDPRLAGVMKAHLGVGRRVVVNGRLKVAAYSGQAGPQVSMQLDASAVNFMDAPGETQTQRPREEEDVLLRAWSLLR